MRTNKLKSALVAAAGASALFVGLGISPASAAPLPFQIDPDALATGGPYANVTVTDLNGSSNATLFQATASTQVETGYVQGQSFTNNGPIVDNTLTRMCSGGLGCASGDSSVYNLYLLFQGTVNGISNFGPNQNGVVNPGGYVFALYADKNRNDVFNVGSTGGATGVNPTVTGTTSDDVLLAVGTAISGGAGQNSIGAPGFSVLANFIVCNGVAGQGLLGNQQVAASVTMSNWLGGAAQSCGTFDATKYFVDPSPFYKLSFNSSTSGSPLNLTTGTGGINSTNATINGVVADINFVSIPEPSTLLLFGSGLLGLGMFARRRGIFGA